MRLATKRLKSIQFYKTTDSKFHRERVNITIDLPINTIICNNDHRYYYIFSLPDGVPALNNLFPIENLAVIDFFVVFPPVKN